MNYKGIGYPVEKNHYGFFSSGNNIQQVKASMVAIIMTRPGERVMRPYFGTPLHKLRRRPPGQIAMEARQMIATSLKQFETRVQVMEVETELMPDGMLDIKVYFVDPHTNIQETQQLTLQMSVLD